MEISFENTALKFMWIQFADDVTGNEARQKIKSFYPTYASWNETPIVKLFGRFVLQTELL